MVLYLHPVDVGVYRHGRDAASSRGVSTPTPRHPPNTAGAPGSLYEGERQNLSVTNRKCHFKIIQKIIYNNIRPGSLGVACKACVSMFSEVRFQILAHLLLRFQDLSIVPFMMSINRMEYMAKK